MITGDIPLTILTGIIKILIYLTTFRSKLAILIRNEEPAIFAERFVKNTLFFFVIMLIVNIILVKTLEKKTIELSRTKSAIEAALEQQRTFIFSFSHELRNPINSLLGNLQLVLQEGSAFSPKAKEMINVAKVCGEILLHNINNVLDTGKYEIGKLEVNPTPTQLSELFQKIWGIYNELFKQKNLKSQLKLEKDLPPVISIDSQKVLLNLIGNSIKFTNQGSISVTIKWLDCEKVSSKCFEPIPYDDVDEGLFEKEENLLAVNTRRIPQGPQNHQESKGVLKIIVKDTGSGMRKEVLDKLFQKFSQVSEDVSQRNIGTGLGLFISKEICNAMNGDIRVYSQFGKGTTFVVCIPTVSAPLNLRQRADSEAILNQLSMKNLKALVADDSPFNVNLISDYLAKFEASVVSVAYNGYNIFQKYRDCKEKNLEINIVTLDIDMPIWDGRKVCDRIREYEKEKRLKPVIIIFISGNYDKEQIEEYLNPQKGLRADCFLRKPVSFSEFHRTVYSLVIKE